MTGFAQEEKLECPSFADSRGIFLGDDKAYLHQQVCFVKRGNSINGRFNKLPRR